jgi:hypothetical protein
LRIDGYITESGETLNSPCGISLYGTVVGGGGEIKGFAGISGRICGKKRAGNKSPLRMLLILRVLLIRVLQF